MQSATPTKATSTMFPLQNVRRNPNPVLQKLEDAETYRRHRERVPTFYPLSFLPLIRREGGGPGGEGAGDAEVGGAPQPPPRHPQPQGTPGLCNVCMALLSGMQSSNAVLSWRRSGSAGSTRRTTASSTDSSPSRAGLFALPDRRPRKMNLSLTAGSQEGCGANSSEVRSGTSRSTKSSSSESPDSTTLGRSDSLDEVFSTTGRD